MDKGVFGRKDRLIKERQHDAYRERVKLPEPSICSECKVIFQQGRWTWGELDKPGHETLCPACRRIHDKLPAGVVHLKGEFVTAHQDEITNLISNLESREKQQHPMERIMGIESENGTRTITTTGVHLARLIGQALARAFKGNLDIQYADGDKTVRVTWER